MKTATLVALLLKLALVESPTLQESSPKHDRYRAGLEKMAEAYVSVGSKGAIVSPDVDPLILAVVGYEESRHRPGIEDGDCHHLHSGTICHSIGPMQLARSTPGLLKRIDPDAQALTVEQLRDPDTAVTAAYRVLQYWKQTCPSTPAALLGTWSAGKCYKRPIAMGTRRCALVRGLADAAGVAFDGCSTTTTDRHTNRLLKALKAPPAQAAGDAKAK